MIKKICPECEKEYEDINIDKCKDCNSELYFYLTKSSFFVKVKHMFSNNDLEDEIKKEVDSLYDFEDFVNDFENLIDENSEILYKKLDDFNKKKSNFKYINKLKTDNKKHNSIIDFFNNFDDIWDELISQRDELKKINALTEDYDKFDSDYDNLLSDYVSEDMLNEFLNKKDLLKKDLFSFNWPNTKRKENKQVIEHAQDIKHKFETIEDRVKFSNVNLDILNFIEDVNNRYVSANDKENIRKEYFDLFKDVQVYKEIGSNLNLDLTNINKFDEIYGDLDNFVIKNNPEFVKQELDQFKEFFNDIDGKSLDENQRKSIVIDEDNMQIIAGAGCGKTLTISGKVKYLMDKGIDKSEILCLSYSKASAEDLVKKLPEGIKASTFHALGKGILKENLGHDVIIGEDLLDNVINDIFAKEILENENLLDKIMDYYIYYSYDVIDRKNKNLGEILEIEEGRYFKTLRETYSSDDEKQTFKYNQKVKSFEELIIANFLFIHGINYEYEKPYVDSEGKKVKLGFSYKPDFYLTDYGIYLEHFGVNRNLDAPWLDKQHSDDYKDKIFRKRELHEKHGTKLIETYSYFASENILISKLHEILEKENVKINEVNYEEILEILAQNDKIKSFKPFINLIKSFINLFKGNNYDSSKFEEFISLAKKESIPFIRKRHLLFLNIVQEIFTRYEKALEDLNAIDFDDMINDATELISQNKVSRNYKYIIVDEYQDISHSRFNLLKAIQKASKSKIFVVGDDWQSIYRFTGCDVSLFTNFDDYFSDYEQCYINNTYRNSQSLIDIAGNFITKNPNQINKELNSKQSVDIENPIKVAYYKDRDISSKIDALEKCVCDISKSSSNILILGRYNKSIKDYMTGGTFKAKSKNKNQPIKITYKKDPSLNITFLTAHSSKGLEEDNVILLDLENDYMGFPSKREDDSVLKYVINESDKFELAEERRLFYVAITRTKKYNYFLVNENKPSQFVEELEEFADFDVISEVKPDYKNDKFIKTKLKCPVCKTGNVSILNINNNFRKFKCSHRGCDWDGGSYTGKFNDLDIIENCPNCDGIVHIFNWKNGPFGTCSNYRSTKCNGGKQLDGKYDHLIEEFKNKEDKSSEYENKSKVKKSQKSETSSKDNSESKSIGKCPRCGSNLVKRNGKYGEFIGCSSFPKCRYTCDIDELEL